MTRNYPNRYSSGPNPRVPQNDPKSSPKESYLQSILEIIEQLIQKIVQKLNAWRDNNNDGQTEGADKRARKGTETSSARSSGFEYIGDTRQRHTSSPPPSVTTTLDFSDEDDDWSEIEKSIDKVADVAKDRFDEVKEKFKKSEKEKYKKAKAESPERAKEQREESVSTWQYVCQQFKTVVGNIVDTIKGFWQAGWKTIESWLSWIQKDLDGCVGRAGFDFRVSQY
ncbi:hypothetical protein AA313_de0203792 [Arthrobotrys entomopaga]|nr:hypothetical protein AA313_de0203792 [Arthrobotrys entomopaga]